jgi:predicted AAA+ superfamily ATPase
MDKRLLQRVMVDNQHEVENYQVFQRHVNMDEFPCYVFVGVRRAGKSFLLYQKMQSMLKEGHGWDEMVYLNFEDDRLGDFTAADFNLILGCQAEMSDKKPTLFLDEIQNIDGWEKFARRLADQKYKVFITGSNAKMLSKEIMATLGGRYLAIEVYPFSLKEFLDYSKVSYDQKTLLSTTGRGKMMRLYNEYLHWGGLPESIGLPVKRNYLESVFQKIYLGDICSRNRITNPNLLRLMVRKMAESVIQPISYNRMTRILSSVGGKVTVPTVSSYVQASEDSWLILRLRNLASAFSEKETVCKYYFIDNGILNLFLFDAETALLENMVALELFRRYGHDSENERVFYYNDRMEIDFYVPEEQLAIQASYSIRDKDTYDREVGALGKFPAVHPCRRRMIITYDEEQTVSDAYGNIEVVPFWKWALA